jgi:hypothetical protein
MIAEKCCLPKTCPKRRSEEGDVGEILKFEFYSNS